MILTERQRAVLESLIDECRGLLDWTGPMLGEEPCLFGDSLRVQCEYTICEVADNLDPPGEEEQDGDS